MTKENLTLEEQELHFRSERAEKTSFQIKTLEKEYFPFTNFEVRGESGVRYCVEIRSLDVKINACSCPDYHINTLGTCKHIEGVLHFLKKKGERAFARAAKMGSQRIEIFVDPICSQVCFHFPKERENVRDAEILIAPYLSASKTLLTDPVVGMASIEKALNVTSDAIASKIRVSHCLRAWILEQQRLQERENDKKLFLTDVKEGKRSMQMLPYKLLPYQEEGMLHLAFKGRAILADDMGLGKTIQAIAACELLRRLNRIERVLVVMPASLKGEWEEQIARFSGLSTLIVNGSRAQRLAFYKKEAFYYLVNYEQVRNDYDEIQTLLRPDVMILDEAQRVKNWQTKTAQCVKRIRTPYAFVLTGTPIENRIDDLYSIMQIVNPKILGPLFKFNQNFYDYDEKGKAIKYKNLNELQRCLKSILLRRHKKDVEEQLPERTIKHYFVQMGSEQMQRYEEYSDQVAKLLSVLKRRSLTPEELKKLQRLLACMRMVADTPYILDEECRECPKLEELEEILKGFMECGDNKIIIFSEWERMLFLVRELAEKLGLDFAWHTGSVPQDKRRADIERFKEDSQCRLFLTTDSGSTGLNLQVANVVINLDLPWNPAKLEQRIARAWRKNQTRVVQVIHLISEETIEHRMLSTLAMKQAVADIVLDASQEVSEMPLPSASRDDFIKRLEALTGEISTTFNPTPVNAALNNTDPSMSFKQELLARYSDRIHLLETHDSRALLVVDKVDHALQERLGHIAPTPVEVIDFETYVMLQRLISAGLIHFNSSKKHVLFQSELIQKDERALKQQKWEEATLVFKEAERKLKMANLLKSGGFVLEALPAAGEALDKGLLVFKILEKTVSAIALQLKDQRENPENPENFIDLLSEWIQETSGILTQIALGVSPTTSEVLMSS